jgi:hypothetical protein
MDGSAEGTVLKGLKKTTGWPEKALGYLSTITAKRVP